MGASPLGREVVAQLGGSRLPALVKLWIGHVVVCVLNLQMIMMSMGSQRKVVGSFTSAAVARNTT